MPDISVEKIIEGISEEYGKDVLRGKIRDNIGRAIGVYLCRNLAGVKNIDIGRFAPVYYS